jgi:TonB family protein
MPVLMIKVTLLFLAAAAAVAAMRKSTAALRHLVCACALAGSLLLPATVLLPERMIAIPLPLTIQAVATATKAAPAGAGWSWVTGLIALWACGCAVLLLRLASGHARAMRVVRRATPSGTDGVYFADVDVPIVCGLANPTILMPVSSREWPAWQFDAAIRHERTHVGRKDLWASFAAQAACAVWWFHPLAWILFRCLRNDQEAACDDAILFSGFEPATYAEALLAVARTSTPNLLNGCAMTTQMNLKSRIARLLDRSIARTTSRTGMLRAAAVFALAFAAIGIITPLRSHAQAGLPGEVFNVGGGVSSPKVLDKVEPEYTEEARARKLSGTVLLSVVIGADGIARDINIVRGIGAGLDESAAAAIEKWRFEPGTREDVPVAVRATIEVNFKMM